MKIFIIGITGYLGSNLASHFQSRGFTVAGSSRSNLALGDPVSPTIFEGAGIVLHAAHDLTPGAMARNIEGARACFTAARSTGAKSQIFLSSYAARPDATSEYGRTKHHIEQMFLESGETVLRPGLVIGNGGLYARQRAALLRAPIVPLIGDGTEPVALIALSHFLEATEAVIRSGKSGAYSLFYENRPTLRDFIRAVKQQAGQRCIFLPIPAPLAIAALRLARALGIRLPADPDQIKSLQSNRTSPWQSDLPTLLPSLEPDFKSGAGAFACQPITPPPH